MKSSINVRYNVYAPKAERNNATHLNRATRTVYPFGSKFKVPRGASSLEQNALEQMHSVTQALNSAVRSSVKHLNSAMNTNDSVN